MSRRLLATVLALFAFAALPGAALAQSAGDDQYVDPLGGGSGSAGQSSGGDSGAGSSVTTSGTTSPGASQALPSELARTGAELPLLAGAGALLLVAGVGLRRRSGVQR